MKIYHELDKNSSPIRNQEGEFYTLQIVVEDGDKSIKIRSRIYNHFRFYSKELDRYVNNNRSLKDILSSNNFRQDDIDQFTKKMIFPFFHMLEDEKKILGQVIAQEMKIAPQNEFVGDLNYKYIKYTSEITDLLDEQIKENYISEIKRIFVNSIDSDIEKEIFNITNYFLHFINWDNNFYEFYETTCDLMLRQVKNLEMHFNKSFKSQLKAFLAYHSKVKILNRFFENRELGRINTVSYLDWMLEIKGFLMIEFEKIFGEKVAIEYILNLDHLLDEAFAQRLNHK